MNGAMEFWCKVYIQAVARGASSPEFIADRALSDFEDRFCPKMTKTETEVTDEN